MSLTLRNVFVRLLARKTADLDLSSSYFKPHSYSFHTRPRVVGVQNSGQKYFATISRNGLQFKFLPTGSHGCKMSTACDDISIRRAVLEDKEAVMALDDAIVSMDYLDGFYSDFIEDPDANPVVVIKDNKVVAFCMTTTFDGGLTVMKRGGRVAKSFRGSGIIYKLWAEIDKHTTQHRPQVQYETGCYSEKEDRFLRRFLRCGYKPIYRKGLMHKSVPLNLPKKTSRSAHPSMLGVPEKALPPARPTMLDFHNNAPLASHSTMQYTGEKALPSAHVTRTNVQEIGPSFAQPTMLDVYGNTSFSARATMLDVYENTSLSAQPTMLDVYENSSLSAHATMLDGQEYGSGFSLSPMMDFHEDASFTSLTTMLDIHEETPSAVGFTMPDVYWESPPSVHTNKLNVHDVPPPASHQTMLDVYEMSPQDLSVLFQTETYEARVFPQGRLFNFYLSYRLQDENIPALLCERGGAFYSMDPELTNTANDGQQNRNATLFSHNNTVDSKNHSNQFSENDNGRVSSFEISRNELNPSDAHCVAMVTFFYSVRTQTGYLYFIDVYSSPQLSTSRDHLFRHLQRHLVTARRRFPNQNGVWALSFDLHLSKDMIESCLDEMGITETIPMCENSVLYEKAIISK